MKKYLRLTCTVCKRFTDKLVDNTRFTPDKCTITFKCLGQLIPVEYRSDGQITPAPEVGVVDWRRRGTPLVDDRDLQETTFINTSTGETKQLFLAVKADSYIAAGSTLDLTLNVKSDTPKNFRQYVYRLETTFTSVSGVESGLEKKALRYTTSDEVSVFLNGVKLEQGTAPENYSLNDGTPTSTVAPNTISFNQQIALPGITQVDVIVSPAQPVTQVLLTFDRNEYDESRVSTGAWENIDSVLKFENGTWNTYYLFRLDLNDAAYNATTNPTGLKLNTILSPTSASVNATSVALSRVLMLLARAPYSNLDRYTNVVAPMTSLSLDRDYLKYFVVDGTEVLYLVSTGTEQIFPILKLQKFTIEKTIKTALSGASNQVVIDGGVIVGPDV